MKRSSVLGALVPEGPVGAAVPEGPEAELPRKEKILQLATGLFHRKGYAATSMRELASLSGIEAPSLYSHFASKEALLQFVCFDMAQAFLAEASRVAAMDLHVTARLARAIEGHLTLLFSDREAVGVFVHEWRHLSEPALQRFKALRLEYEHAFGNLFREGMEQGLFRQGDPLWLGRQLLLLMNGSIHSNAHASPDFIKELSQRFYLLWLQGIQHPNSH